MTEKSDAENMSQNENVDVNNPSNDANDDKIDDNSSNRPSKNLSKVVSDIKKEDLNLEKSEEEKKLVERNRKTEKVDVPEFDIIDKENLIERVSLDVNKKTNFANHDMADDDASIRSNKNLPHKISEIKEEDDESEEIEEEKKLEESNLLSV